MLKIISATGVAALALMACNPAFAQDQPPASADPTGTEQPAIGGEIVVTALRRTERLQDVPISITAIGGPALAASGILNTAQLGQVTPGLVFTRNSTAAQFSIRGIAGRATYPGDESGVALYVDGIYQPTPFANAFDLISVERVEVLRGPQGTLFGRNATAGLINVVTADPSFTTKGVVEAQYGNFDTFQLRGRITGPLSEKIALDLAGNYYTDDGYVRDLVRGGRSGERETKSLRGRILLEPSETVRLLLTGSLLNNEDSSAVVYGNLAGNSIGTRFPTSIIAAVPRTSALTFDPFVDIKVRDVTLKATVDLGSLALESATTYQVAKTLNATDNDGTNVVNVRIDSDQIEKHFMQELRLSSDTDGPFTWTGGVFYFDSVGRYRPIAIRSSGVLARNRTEAVAPFAEGTYAITDAFELTVGARYTWETRNYTYRGINYVNPAPSPKVDYKLFTPRVVARYEFSPRANAYASYSRGAKSGLFNTTGPLPNPIAPEYLQTWELGLKTDPASWLRFNVSAFYNRYRDIQLAVRDATGITGITNAGRATTYGGEIEATLRPAQGLTFNLGMSLLHTNLDEYNNADVTVRNPATLGGNAVVRLPSLTGTDLIRAPSYTINFGMFYDFSLGSKDAGLSASYYLSDKFYFNYNNRVFQPRYNLLNAQIWLEPVKSLRVSLYGENLTDANVLNNALDSANGDLSTYVRPRSYGVRARFTL